MYWFTNSYRKNEAKFQNNLLNEGKSEVSASGLLLCPRLCEARAHGPQAWPQIRSVFSKRCPKYDPRCWSSLRRSRFQNYQRPAVYV